MLWIAFKLFNFDLLKQRVAVAASIAASCELLSNYLILTCWNSWKQLNYNASWLWIAFKLFNFDLLKQPTDKISKSLAGCELLSNYLILTCWNSKQTYIDSIIALWIAFKLFNFDLLKQLSNQPTYQPMCCELLSNYLILTCWNSCTIRRSRYRTVVNCFQTI